MWPTPQSSEFSSAVAAKKKRDRRRQLERERGEGPARTQSETVTSLSAETVRHLDALSRAIEVLQGPEFRAWYEVTTGKPVEPWLEGVLISHEQFIEMGNRLPNETQIDWIEARVRFVAQRNPWTNPDMKAFWGGQITACTDAIERRALLLKMATPPWASKEKMRAIYLERARLEAETGIPHDVDHIIPIVNRRVCGLHWEGNLRVIPASENRSKSNFFDPDGLRLTKSRPTVK